MPKNSHVREATVHVEASPDSQGRYPWNVAAFADSASNSTMIYAFSGQAYGAMGRQTLFDAGVEGVDFRFRGSGSGQATVLLPKGATVHGASMTVVGAGFNQGYSGPDFLHEKVGSNFVQLDTGLRAAPYLVDIDTDGDLDLFAAGANYSSTFELAGGPRFFRNVGNATAYQFSEEPSVMAGVVQAYGASPALADLDGDGDLDLLVVGGPYQGFAYN
ncbi:MAG: FG-GAP-like repeat-containing protein, partial [Actinomycetota bacterium]